jgi:hypothetical protein
MGDYDNISRFSSDAKFKSVPSVRKGSDENIGVAVFFDYDQINNYALENDIEIDYAALKTILLEDNNGVGYAYLDIDKNRKHLVGAKEDVLWNAGYLVKKVEYDKVGIFKVSNKYSQMAIDILFLVLDENYKSIIIVGGDAKLSDLVIKLREKQVEVSLVNFDAIVDLELKKYCTNYLSLNNVEETNEIEDEETDEVEGKVEDDGELEENTKSIIVEDNFAI